MSDPYEHTAGHEIERLRAENSSLRSELREVDSHLRAENARLRAAVERFRGELGELCQLVEGDDCHSDEAVLLKIHQKADHHLNGCWLDGGDTARSAPLTEPTDGLLTNTLTLAQVVEQYPEQARQVREPKHNHGSSGGRCPACEEKP